MTSNLFRGSVERDFMADEHYLFGAGSYDTAPGTRRALGARVFGRWYFYWFNFNIFSKTGRLFRKGRCDKATQISQSNRNVRLVERCGGRIHLRGLEHLAERHGAPAVLIGNHMSLLETALMHAIVREHLDFTFVIKASLMKIPHFRNIMTGLEAIQIGRSNPREDLRAVLEEGKERLGRGKSVVIFPQGTRSTTFDPAHFSSIGVKLALAAGVPVIPFALKTDFLGNGRFIKDLGPIFPENDVWFEFGPAMTPTGNGREEQQRTIEFIVSRLKMWRKDADDPNAA